MYWLWVDNRSMFAFFYRLEHVLVVLIIGVLAALDFVVHRCARFGCSTVDLLVLRRSFPFYAEEETKKKKKISVRSNLGPHPPKFIVVVDPPSRPAIGYRFLFFFTYRFFFLSLSLSFLPLSVVRGRIKGGKENDLFSPFFFVASAANEAKEEEQGRWWTCGRWSRRKRRRRRKRAERKNDGPASNQVSITCRRFSFKRELG